jgi:hypothetical protein
MDFTTHLYLVQKSINRGDSPGKMLKERDIFIFIFTDHVERRENLELHLINELNLRVGIDKKLIFLGFCVSYGVKFGLLP